MNAPGLYAFVEAQGLWLIFGLLALLVTFELITHAEDRLKRVVEVFSTLVGIIIAVIFALGQSQFERVAERREAAASLLQVIEVTTQLEIERVQARYFNLGEPKEISLAFSLPSTFFESSLLPRAERVLSDPTLFIYGDRFFVEVFIQASENALTGLRELQSPDLCEGASVPCARLWQTKIARHRSDLSTLRGIACLQRGEISGRLEAGAVQREWVSERLWTEHRDVFFDRTGCAPAG